MTMYSGFTTRVKVNNQFYAVRRWNVEEAVPDLDVTNSEGRGGGPAAVSSLGLSASVPGPRKITFRLVGATYDDTQNPYAAPFSLTVGLYSSAVIYANTTVGQAWTINNFMVVRISQEVDVAGLSPMTIEGTGDGFYGSVG